MTFSTCRKFTYLEFSTCNTCPHQRKSCDVVKIIDHLFSVVNNPHNITGFPLMRTCVSYRKFKVCEFSTNAESQFKIVQMFSTSTYELTFEFIPLVTKKIPYVTFEHFFKVDHY